MIIHRVYSFIISALLAMVLPALGGAVTANFTSVSTVPVTAESYTAIGNTVSLSLGFMPPTGTDLMVVKNTGIAFITGRFSNLAQGQVVNLAYNGVTYKYVANYYGGTGNDLVLHWAYQDLSAWGCNNYCQLGNNSTTNSSVPIIVNQSGVLAGKTVIAVAGGGYQDGAYDTLALCSDGTLASWGYNGYGQLGNNSYTDSHVPGLVTQNGVLAGKTVVSISAGYHHSLALCSDGTVAAWGWNSNGQLGNNSATNSSVPVLVTASGALAGKTVVSIAAGGTFSLALCSDGTVAGWGWNAYGQLGNNSATSSSVPVLATQSGVLAGKTVISVAAGYSHSLAVCSDGTVAAWGSNYYGQLGNNSSANSSVPVLISQSGVLAGKTIISASAGWIHSVALCSDGTIVAWGYNASGCLGNNSTTDSGVPVLVTQSGILVGKTGVSVAAGTYYSLALCSDGTMAAWGQNSFGNLGNNSTNNSSVPVLVDQSGVLASKTVTSITSGGFHSLALAAIQNSSNLTNLTLSSGTLSPAFAAATTSYTASVPNATTSITVTPTLSDATATVKVKGTTVTPGTASGAISLVVGTNVITTVVTAQDGTTTKSYTVNVTRISNVATLSGLSLNSGTLSPTFAAGSTSYAASVPNATTSITVRPTVTDTTATIKVNGTTVASGTASGLIELSVGANVITTVITAQDGVTTNTYTVTVTRNSNISTLSGLVLGSGTLSPTFAVGTLSYTGSVPNATSSITVTPTVTDPNATIKVNGTTVASGVASQSIPMVAGSNSINVVGTAQDGTTLSTYTVTVTRAFFEAVFTSATTVPISASGYNATGNGVNLTLGFAPPTGTDLMVVKNTGLAFITGQFSNLTQGQVVNLTYNGVTYKYVANYYGGTGNDLVLHWAYQDLATWGYNEFGQLGNNSFTDSGVPVLATQSGVLAGKTVVSVSAGIWHCLALCSDGTVAAWGDDLEGELGNNRATNSSVPVLVTQSGVLAGKTVIAVDTCGWHSLALCSDGTVAAWGANTLGQLGNGSTTNSSVPVLVNQSGVLAGKTVVQIAAGADFNLALCSDGSLATWGYDTTNQYNVPVLVTQSGVLAGKAVVSISGGRCHSLALCSDGTLVAWGYGWSGQLGNNSTTDSSAPVLVTQSGVLAGKTIISVAAGTAHNLALCSDGTLAAWGWNVAGQLGNNSTTDSLVPVLVTQSGVLAGKTVVSISAGQTLSLALCSDGTLAAWGFSGIGLLGNGGTTDSSVPVLVTQSGVLAGKMVGTVSTGGSSGIALAAVPNTSNQLSNLTLSAGTLSPTFDPATIAYTASVLYATSSITVTPTSAANVASVSVNGTPVTTGSMSQAFPLAVGSNIITTVVTAPDGVTTKTYTVTVTRAAPPVVTNISVAQRAGTRLVDITYDMTADFPTVWVGLEISMDGGATYSVATTTVSGAVGAGVAPGTGRVITWDAGADWNGQSTSLMCFKVTAIDTLSNFSLIPQGSFQMGNAMAADTDITDAPIRTVNVSAFYMGRNLVTKTDWDTVRTWGQSHGYTDLTVGAGKAANHPVQTITWYDTVKWCNARSEMEGLTPCYYTDAAQTVVYRAGNADLASTMVKWAANGYRLPTVAEWEKAARGGLSGKRFPWGDTISESQANYYGNTGNSYDLGPNGHNSIGSIGGTDPYTSPVGSFPANGYGLYDMAGNVFKWCWDWYGPYAAGAQTDPRGAATGNARVILGGDWSYGAGYCRVAYRSPFNPPTNSQYNTGFRVARSVVMPDPAVFSLIPAGSFQMGNAMAADTDITDAPIRTVTTSAFYMARNLVTKAAWDTVRTWGLANGYTDLSAGAGKASNHPVQTITWYDMVKWCNARSEMEGLTPCYTLGGAVYRTNSDDAVVCNWAVSGYRMPSEAEWEKSARGGLSGKRFPWGDTISQSQANYLGATGSYSYDLGPNGYNSIGSIGGTSPATSPVGSFASNGYGLYDMAGNVWEYCWDWLGTYATGAQTDPRGVSSGSLRVLRGGAGYADASESRSARRGYGSPASTYNFIGFRVARSMLADSVVAIASNASIDTRSTVATLSGLIINSGTLSPTFVAATTSYTASVTNATTSITVAPTVTDTTATMKVNGTTVGSGAASQSIPLIAGNNAITTVVTAQDGTTTSTYTVTVTRVFLNAVFTSATTVPFSSLGYNATTNAVNVSLGYAPTVGTNLTLVDNTGLSFITGRFSNLAQGQVITLSYHNASYRFVVNYYGGTGNDLVLQWANDKSYAWGSNIRGQLGEGTANSSSVPVAVTASGVLSGKTILSVSVGSSHSLALCSDGTVAAWGYNIYGQLGNSGNTDSSVPVAVTQSGVLAGKTVVAVSAGYSHSLALCSDGTVACWGRNLYGQLGNGNTTNSNVPVLVTTSGILSGKGVTSVVAGYYHNLALCADGTVVAWGHNNSGQLGNNSIIDSSVPVNITASGALNGVSAITLAAGINHSLVLCDDGSLVSWGNNTNGQLGDGTTTSSLTPVNVYAYGVLAGQVVEKISAGGFHNLVVCSDGTLVAFGMNTYGQLGNGGNTDSSMPVTVTLTGALNGKTVTAIQAANAHSLALCSDGSIASWGAGGSGLLGNGGIANSNVPVAVTASGIGMGEKFIALAGGSSASHSMALTAVPLSSGSTLASLALSSGTLSPTFVAGTLSYAASVPSATPSITVTPTVTDATATVTVNGTLVASGSASASIPLAVGSNTITVVGIPQDGVTLTTYTVTVTRAGSYDLWKSVAFTNPTDLANPAVSGELATPANDGISNLMKYALALNPTASATGNLPATSRQSGYLTLTYRKSKTASDVTYTVQAADGLSNNAWTSAATVLSQIDPTPGGGSYWLVTVRDNVPYTNHPQRFMRLQVVK